MKSEIKIIDFKLGEEEHVRRNWEQQTPCLTCEETINYYKKLIVQNCKSWEEDNYTSSFIEMLDYSLLVNRIMEMQYQDYNNTSSPTYKKDYKIIIYYDYSSEEFIIEKQIDL